MDTLLLVAADAREFSGIRRHCRREERLRWPLRFARSAWLGRRRLLMVANGPGPRLAGEACEAAWARQRADAMISTGFCGGLDPALNMGDIFTATMVESPGQTASIEARSPECGRPFASGKLFSIDRIAVTAEEKQGLRGMGGSAVEMEAAAVGQHSRAWGVPFYCIRSVTDVAFQSFHLDLNAMRDREGRLSSARIVWAAICSPAQGLPELYELGRSSRVAASTLGDFFADCQF